MEVDDTPSRVTALRDALAGELNALLRLRNSTDLADLNTPILDQLAEDADSRDPLLKVDAIQDSIEAGIDRLGADAYKEAARALFRRSLRFASMKEKGSAAALEFGVSYDAFRRRPATGLSRLGETVNAVAGSIALVAAHPDELLVSESSKQSKATAARLAVVVAGAAVLVAIALAVVLLTDRGAQDAEPAATTEVARTSREPAPIDATSTEETLRLEPVPCRIAVGEAADNLFLADERRASFETIFDANGGGSRLGCAVEMVTERGGLLWQEVRRNNLATGGLLGLSDGEVLYLNAGQWRSFIRVGGGDGTASPGLGGVPTGQVEQTADGWSMALNSDVEMLAEAEDGIYYWLPVIVVNAWNEAGRSTGLQGSPAGRPRLTDEGMRQDFENGYRVLRGDGELDWVEVADPRADLPDAESLVGRIVEATDGTAWLIDHELRRWWLVDEIHRSCAGGNTNTIASGLPGYAIHTLEFGGRFSCPGAESGVTPARGGLVLREYCEAEIAGGAGVETDGDGGWRCISGNASVPISLGAACGWQYGPAAVGTKDDSDSFSWQCANP